MGGGQVWVDVGDWITGWTYVGYYTGGIWKTMDQVNCIISHIDVRQVTYLEQEIRYWGVIFRWFLSKVIKEPSLRF